jgi:hypothetical protein
MNNGKEYQYFVVVKNVPFIIVISSKGDTPVNFKKNTISASLLYDCDPRKEVSLIRSTPLEYVTHISSNGEEITIEARIHVLTSQQEDSLFRVCVSFNGQEVTSEPLKVISKADNVRKPKNSSSPSSSTTPSVKKKRTANDAFGETLQRIEQQQQEQRKLIDLLCQQNQLLMNKLKQVDTDNVVPTPSSNPPSPTDTCSDIETAFSSFINCYASLSPVERPHKVRALQKTVHQSKTLIVEFTNNFLTQQPTLLDEVLGIDSETMFGCDIEAELAHFVPSSPMSLPSPSAVSPLSSPERSDSLDGYWSLTFSETNSPLNNDFVDIDSELTDNFISELLSTSTDCTSIC